MERLEDVDDVEEEQEGMDLLGGVEEVQRRKGMRSVQRVYFFFVCFCSFRPWIQTVTATDYESLLVGSHLAAFPGHLCSAESTQQPRSDHLWNGL